MWLVVESMHLIHVVFMLLEERNTLLESRVARKIGLPNGAASIAEICCFIFEF